MGMAVGALFIRDNFNHESKVRNCSELGMAFQKQIWFYKLYDFTNYMILLIFTSFEPQCSGYLYYIDGYK